MPKKEKKVVNGLKNDSQVIGTVAAISNADGPCVLIEDDAKMTWVTLGKGDLKLLLAGLGPDPLDGRRKVLIRSGERGDIDVTVYAGKVV